MLKRFLSYYKSHWVTFVFDMLASFVMAVIAIFYPMITRAMLNDLIPNRKYTEIIIYGIGLLVVYLVRMGLSFYVQYCGHVMGVKMQAKMRSDLFNHLEKMPFKFFDNNETGKIMSRMTGDLFDVAELAHHGPENFIITGVSIIISFVYLALINFWLSLIVFACVPFLLFVSLYLRNRMRDAFKKRRESNAVINAALESSISGIRVTKAFTNAEEESKKFEKGNEQFVDISRTAYKAMGQFHSTTTFITDVFNVIIVIAGGIFLFNGKIEFGDYSAFIVSVNLFINPVNTLIRFMESFQNGVSGFERFIEIMDTEPETDPEDAVDIGKLSGDIEFKNVSYRYDSEKNDDVLKNVSFKINKGMTYALVGPSGGGKTTICHLIPHFYNVESGNILVDGVDINTITRESLRKNIGIVQQDVYLFNSSIKENILYGRLDATFDEVVEAAKRANIHDYVMTLPNGYDTVIGERGVKLSGGQKQRLCIARVFLKNPPILILDEATSALDNATEIMIQQSLDELCLGRTTLVVAHRLSTIKNADKIAVVSDGKLCEEGTHEQLIVKNGIYAELYKKQFRTEN